MEIARVALFGKLNSTAYRAIEGATVFCKLRGNPYVELVHWMHQLLQAPDSDLARIVTHFKLDAARLASDIAAALDRLPRGATSISNLSNDVEDAVERAWVYSTLMFGFSAIRTGTLFIAMLKTRSLCNVLMSISREFDKVSADVLTDNFAAVTGESPEQFLGANDGTQLQSSAARRRGGIFICYRRDDSAHATGRIFDRLIREFGRERVFKDVNSIPVGIKDYEAEIQAQLESTCVVLAVVGESWLSARDEGGRRRLDKEDDPVRIELKWGLDNEHIAVIPVLLDKVRMPDAVHLPEALKGFVRCQAANVRANLEFERDMESLLQGIRHCLAMSTRSAAD